MQEGHFLNIRGGAKAARNAGRFRATFSSRNTAYDFSAMSCREGRMQRTKRNYPVERRRTCILCSANNEHVRLS